MTSPVQLSSTEALQEELKSLHNRGLKRRLQIRPPELISFAHNDYLGLARDPRLAEAAIEVLKTWGTGAQAARLISGHTHWHQELEISIARLKKTEASLLFPSGYAAATGALPSVLRPGDYVIMDALCHACLFDGSKLAGAYIKIFRHNDLEHAEEILQWVRSHSLDTTRILVVAESLYSMDGDFGPLKELVALKKRFGAWLMIDEAHATGLYGPEGRGLVAAANLSAEIDVQIGTLSKAIGVNGGFIAGSQSLIDLLLHKARSFLFTTGTPPALAAAALRSLEIIQSPEGDSLRSRLQTNIALFKGTPEIVTDADSPIHIVTLGSEEKASEASQALLNQGILVPAVRYPTVPLKQARLRISLNSQHTLAELNNLLGALSGYGLENAR